MRKPELSELERVKMENYTLRILFLQQQLQQMQSERTTFICQIMDAHPGYEWSETQGLVAKEEAEEPYPEFTPH